MSASGNRYVTDWQRLGVIFSGQAPFIADDESSPTNPTLSGFPEFGATVSQFSVVVGLVDTPGSTMMTVYNRKGQQLGVLIATDEGFNQLYSNFPGAASFAVSTVADEPNGGAPGHPDRPCRRQLRGPR